MAVLTILYCLMQMNVLGASAASEASKWSVGVLPRTASSRAAADGRNQPLMETCFYGGNLDGRAALNSQRNTTTPDSWIFDDVEWPGGAVSVVWGHFANRDLLPVAADVTVYEGLGEGVWGTRIVEILDITDLTWEATGRKGPGGPEYELRLNTVFPLPPGSYHIGLRPVGSGGRLESAFIFTTSGQDAQGSPIGNGQVFFQSFSFGFPTPTDIQNLIGQGNWDVSVGLCGETQPGVALSLEGECPGVMTARVGGATPGGRIALIRSAPGRCGGQTTIPPPNPCAGTVLPLGGAALVRLITADGEGNAAVTGNVPVGVCGRICLVVLDLPTCEVSNVAEF